MVLLTTVIIVSAIAFGIWKLSLGPLLRYRRFLNKVGWSPQYFFPPPIGHSFQFSSDSEVMLMQIKGWLDKAKTGLVSVWMGSQPIMFVTNADVAEQVLRSPDFNTKGYMYNFLLPWLHTGLLTSTGEKWRRRRKLLTPAFHFAILKTYFDTMKEQVDILLEVIRETGPKATDVRKLITNCTLDIICETAMGVHPNAQQSGDNNPYVSAVKRSNELILKRMITPVLWPDWLYNLTGSGQELKSCLQILHDYTKKTILDRQAELARTRPSWLAHLENDSDHSDGEERGSIDGKLPLLDLLIATSSYSEAEQNGSLSQSGSSLNLMAQRIDLRGIQEEVDTFMFEGHDTTANALIWALQRIAEAPDVQKKIHLELDEVFGPGSGPNQRPITFDDLSRLTYLEMVIKEVLRLYPPVPILQRRVDADSTLRMHGESLTIPKGMQITIIPYLLHRDERQFENGDAFDPERFSRESLNKGGRHPYAYVPFSAGPRNCIGQKFAMMEEKTLLAGLFRRYLLVTEQTSEKIGLKPDLILRPKRPVMIKFLPRTQAG